MTLFIPMIHRMQAPEIHESSAPDFQKAFDYPFCLKNVPTDEIVEGRYVTRFARTPEEIDAALRLRFTVFNLELNEGLESSFLTERDEDEFDLTCHHLIVIEKETNLVVGTYRLRTLETAQNANGFYSAGEFRLENLPSEVLAQSLKSDALASPANIAIREFFFCSGKVWQCMPRSSKSVIFSAVARFSPKIAQMENAPQNY